MPFKISSRRFERFGKIYLEKQKKNQLLRIRDYVMHTIKSKFCMLKKFFRKCLFVYQILFEVEKKTKFFGPILKLLFEPIQNFCAAIKKC